MTTDRNRKASNGLDEIEVQDSCPPSPPTIHRLVALSRPQWALLGVLVVFPLLGLAGLFGDRSVVRQASLGALQISAEVPAVTRYQVGVRLSVRLHNEGNRTLSSIRVEFDSTYVDRFGVHTFVPSPDHGYLVRVDSLRAGEERLLRLDLESDEIGRHAGTLRIGGEAMPSVSIPLRTLVLP